MRKFPVLVALGLFNASPLAAQVATAPAATPAPIDPARLTLATAVVGKVFPIGTYKRLMGGTMDRVMDTMVDSVGAMPIAQIAAIGGLSSEDAAKLPRTSLAEVMAIYDPDYRRRTQLGMHAMMDSMTELMSSFEPQIRTALSRAYARKFSEVQLRDLDAFFKTPTGTYYAAESMGLYMDPELMREMQAFAPEMIKRMPEMAKKAETATASLPKPRKIGDLTPAERTKLAGLLGVKPADLTDPPPTPFADPAAGTP